MDTREELAYATGVQALTWGYPLIRCAVANRANVAAGAASVNSFRLFDQVTAAADRRAVTPTALTPTALIPNAVTLDGYAIVEPTAEPVVLHVPVLPEKRWYLLRIGDMFDEVVVNIGGAKGPGPGVYALCGPDFHGQLPAEITPVRLRTRVGSAALRVFVRDEDDAPAAASARRGFRLLPLSSFLAAGLGGHRPDGGTAPGPTDSTGEQLRSFDHLGQAMQWYLPTSGDRDDPLIASFRHIGLTVADGFVPTGLDHATLRGLVHAAAATETIIDARWATAGETVDRWRYHFSGGRSGHDHTLRSALAKYVLGAQLACEVLHPRCAVDANGRPFHGSRDYVLHFPAGQIPPVSVFWNLALYGSDNLFVANDHGRYGLGSATEGLRFHRDGSLTLHIRREQPDDPAAAPNWLPTPEGEFTLTMHLYGPDVTVQDGTYRLPAVTAAN